MVRLLILAITSIIPTSALASPTTRPAAPPAEKPTLSARLDVAGIREAEGRRFLTDLQAAVSARDRDAIVRLVRYPFRRFDHGKVSKAYATPAALLADFDRVFTPRVLDALKQAKFDDLFFNYRGGMVADGALWFDQCDDGVRIIAVNP
jgi:hypothetical protein